MPISLTCTCGARLEIDDKFAGQSIPCPDCNKPLLAEAPAPPPTRTSGLAVLSLLLALVGAFTIVGTLAAIACGAVAYKQLTRRRSPIGGVRIAQAGMILGAVFTVIAMAAYGSRTLLGIDSLVRRYVWESRLKYPTALVVTKTRTADDSNYSLDRPSLAWGVVSLDTKKPTDHLMVVNVQEDAQILWLSDRVALDDINDPAGLRARALDCFRASDLVSLIGKVPSGSDDLKTRGVDDAQRIQEFFLDVTMSGIPRTFIFRLSPEGQFVNIVVGGTRAGRFDRLKDDFRRALDSFKQEVGR